MDTSRPEPMLRWFVYAHLPAHLQPISTLFNQAATALCEPGSPSFIHAGPERTVALRKLVEAKDAAVRQAVDDARARETNGVHGG